MGRTHSFQGQLATGTIGENIFHEMYPEYTRITNKSRSIPYDFISTTGEKIEIKTCKTYPNVYVNCARFDAKEDIWKPYGPYLSHSQGIDKIVYVYLNKDSSFKSMSWFYTSRFVGALTVLKYTFPPKKDSNKDTRIYNAQELDDYMLKNNSTPPVGEVSAGPYTILLTAKEAENRELWLRRRSEGLGCSDIYTLTGKSKWKSPQQLLDEKVFGLKEEITDPVTLQKFWWGHAMEPLLTDWWNHFKKDELGIAQEWQELLKSTRVEGLVGTPDARCEDKLIEYKTTNPRTYTKSWMSGKRVPEHYYYQVQAQMLLTGLESCYVMVARAIGIAPRILKVEKDQEIIDKISYTTEEFWGKVIEERERHANETSK